METVTARAADTADYIRNAIADSKASTVETIDLFNKLIDKVYEQYLKRNVTEEIDQLSAKLALAILWQESASTPAVTAEQSVTLRAEPRAEYAVN